MDSKRLSPSQYEAIGRFFVASSRLEYHVHDMIHVLANTTSTAEYANRRIMTLGKAIEELENQCKKISSSGRLPNKMNSWVAAATEISQHRNHHAHGFHNRSLADPEWIVVIHVQVKKGQAGRTFGPTYSVGPVIENPYGIYVSDLRELTKIAEDCIWDLARWKSYVERYIVPKGERASR